MSHSLNSVEAQSFLAGAGMSSAKPMTIEKRIAIQCMKNVIRAWFNMSLTANCPDLTNERFRKDVVDEINTQGEILELDNDQLAQCHSIVYAYFWFLAKNQIKIVVIKEKKHGKLDKYL